MRFKRIGRHIFVIRREYYGDKNNWSDYTEDITEIILYYLPTCMAFFAIGYVVAKFLF